MVKSNIVTLYRVCLKCWNKLQELVLHAKTRKISSYQCTSANITFRSEVFTFDLSPSESHLWGHLKTITYTYSSPTTSKNEETLQRTSDASYTTRNRAGTFGRERQSVIRSVHVRNGWGTDNFELLFLILTWRSLRSQQSLNWKLVL